MIIDSHQHFWKYNPIRDSWIDDSMKTIRKDFLPEDLEPLLKKNEIDGCVVIQADQSEAETEFLLELAQNNTFIKGVVGWVDLCSNSIEERLIQYSKNSLFKGVRHILQAEQATFFSNSNFLYGISKLAPYNLTYDILIYPHQLFDAIKLVKKFPNQKFVINHIAKPNIKEAKIIHWKKNIQEIASYENVYCKVSGMFTENEWKNWNKTDFTPYLDVIFRAFGTHQIMYGSDWPVCLLAVSYLTQLKILHEYIAYLSPDETKQIMGKNAAHFYSLQEVI